MNNTPDKFFDNLFGWVIGAILFLYVANMMCEMLLDFSPLDAIKRLFNKDE